LILLGDDWSSDHHDVGIQDEQGSRLAKGRLPEGVRGIEQLHAMVAAHADDPAEVAVGIETDRGLWVSALVAAGYQARSKASTPRWRRAIESATARRAPSPTPATPPCWPTWFAPTATSIVRWRAPAT
jgi:hypothetical protein